jgi:peptide deformylase
VNSLANRARAAYNESIGSKNRVPRIAAVLEIVHYPHPSLRYHSRPVTEINDELRATIRAMFDLMYAANGIGLAANQVALPFRFFILNLTADREQPNEEKVLINPEIVKRHSLIEEEEGCLSLPGVYAKVKRAKRVRVRAYDLEGNLVEYNAEDLFSRAIQHETDHLDGKLFIDHLDPSAARSIGETIRGFEQQYKLAQGQGTVAPDAELIRRLETLEHPMISADLNGFQVSEQSAVGDQLSDG